MSTLLYNPDRKNKQQLIEEFVVRTKIFDEIFADIKSSKTKYPEQNYLIIGQRGLGKTTLLTRLKYAIEDDTELKKTLIPVAFSEEQYNISELANLWEEVAIYLEDHHGFKGLYEEMQLQVSKENYEQIAFGILIKYLDTHKKKTVLLIDNLGILLSKFEELEVRRLREILQTRSHLRIIAGSTTALESISDYHQPLYEFFKVIHLKGLTNEESITLLKKLAEVHNESEKIEKIIAEKPGRVETIRTLSGGVPRTMAMLFQVFLDNEHGSAVSDLEKILDLVTPLYKHRMDDLPPQQQKIIDAVAKNWDAVTVKELTERVRLDSKLISAQLRQLEKNQVIEKRTTKTKNHLYLLSERFFNIWYLMRYGRKENRQRVIWLVKFLEVWCDENEIESRINNYITKVKAGALDEETSKIYGEIYSFFEKIDPNTKFLLKESTPEYISKQIEMTENDLDELIERSIEAEDWDRLIKVGLSSNNLNTYQKQQIFTPLVNKEFSDIFLENVPEMLNKDIRMVTKGISDFVTEGMLTILVTRIDIPLSSQNEEGIEQGIDLFTQGYTKAYFKSTYIDMLFVVFVSSFLGFKMYNKALEVFNRITSNSAESRDKYRVLYYAILKLLEQDKELEKLNSEVMDSVNGFIEHVFQLQEEIQSGLSNNDATK